MGGSGQGGGGSGWMGIEGGTGPGEGGGETSGWGVRVDVKGEVK